MLTLLICLREFNDMTGRHAQVQRWKGRIQAEELFQIYVCSTSAGTTSVRVQRQTARQPCQCSQRAQHSDTRAPARFPLTDQSDHRHSATTGWLY